MTTRRQPRKGASTISGIRVGVIARRTGISVRTLHYYEELGLLVPSGRSVAGYRLYSAADLLRLQQIRSLQQLGFSLAEVQSCLEDPAFLPREVVALHLQRVGDRIAGLQQLQARLVQLETWLQRDNDVSAEEFLRLLEEMKAMEKHATPELLAAFKARREQMGEDRLREAGTEWMAVVKELRAAMDEGTDPAAQEVQQLVQRFVALGTELVGDHPAIQTWGMTMLEQEPEQLRQQRGLDKALTEYIGRAKASLPEK